jgi:DNA-binding NarL/FixJ family response regulator
LHGITSREYKVMDFLLKGRSHKEQMAELNISLSTVKNRVSSIYGKTDTMDKMVSARKIRAFSIYNPAP